MAANQLSKEQREFVVRKLAAFYTPRDIASQLSAQFGIKCNEADILANDPKTAVVAPDLFMLYRSERERVLDDPESAPFASQQARLIALSRQAERYESNNQPADARQVYRQIAEELGVVGGAKGAKVPVKDEPRQITEIIETIVDPGAPVPEPAA